MRYDEYFELSEKNGWRITDLDWSALAADAEAGLISDFDRQAVLATAVIEHGVPHYSEVWNRVQGLQAEWELWQFTTLWTGEEHRHSYALQKACHVLGIADRIEDDLATLKQFPFAEKQKDSCAGDCYSTLPGMLSYAVIQELATARFYTMAAKRTQSPTLRTLFNWIGTDETRHHVFYRDALRSGWERSSDQAWYSEQVFQATSSFHMPHLIYGLQETFFEGGDWDITGELVLQLARCFSFDIQLVTRLASMFVKPAAA